MPERAAVARGRPRGDAPPGGGGDATAGEAGWARSQGWRPPPGAAPGWYRAHGDPVVGPALRLLHHEPARPWSVESLARETGVSRAALARRFAELVGEPPMSFLTGWRLALAADLLRDPDATLAAVARQVGYGSPYALSTAFKRVRGVSPREHRAVAAARSAG